MFNLLIGYEADSWNEGSYQFHRSRVVNSYTVEEIRERYKGLSDKSIEELKSLPSLFVTEDESVDSRIGYITNIRLRKNEVVVEFEFDNFLPALPSGTVRKLSNDLDIRGHELGFRLTG